MAGGAWLASGSAVRAVAVLVVATPCPLLLAAPVAIVSGLSRASRHGVVIRSGGALENLGHATTLVMDKTGTLTMGRPVVVEIVTAPGQRRHRGIATGGVGGSDVAARAGRSHRHRSPHPRPAAVAADRRDGGTRPWRHCHDRRSPCSGRQAAARHSRRGMGARGGEPGTPGLGRDRVGVRRWRAGRCRVAARSVAPPRTPHRPAVARRRAEPVGHADRRPRRAGP